MVDVCIYSEKPFKNDSYYIHEIFREWNTKSTWKNFLIVQLIFDPGHQEINIFTRANFEWSFHIMSISPQIFVFWSCAHSRTAFLSTEFHENTVENINFIIEFNKTRKMERLKTESKPGRTMSTPLQMKSKSSRRFSMASILYKTMMDQWVSTAKKCSSRNSSIESPRILKMQ